MAHHTAILGAQWGDEGKGKMVDALASTVDWVVRAQGGHNAGHTLVFQGKKTILHLIPSGVLHPKTRIALGQGVVIAPQSLLDEISWLQAEGVSFGDRFFVSGSASVLLPSHVALDQAREAAQASGIRVGTTGRGIGPAYEDKAARRALRIDDLMVPERLKERLADILAYHNFVLSQYHHVPPVPFEKTFRDLLAWGQRIQPWVADVPALLESAMQRGERILFEGAQGAMLDIDHGTYPFVTSSNTTSGGLCNGAGIGPQHLSRIIGVAKAYCTRVGEGPFPTELQDATGEHLRQVGKELGSTTGRPRRCGWLDLVALRRAALVNGITHWCITKLDVLDDLSEIQICSAYTVHKEVVTGYPSDTYRMAQCVPVCQSMPGWKTSTVGTTDWKRLPQQAQALIEAIEKHTQVPVGWVSTGPERGHMVVRDQA